jgi:hypothetical protein
MLEQYKNNTLFPNFPSKIPALNRATASVGNSHAPCNQHTDVLYSDNLQRECNGAEHAVLEDEQDCECKKHWYLE